MSEPIVHGPRFNDLRGQRFGKLLVLAEAGKSKDNQILWLCRCDCGNEKAIRSGSLRKGNTKACGCENGKTPSPIVIRPDGVAEIHLRSGDVALIDAVDAPLVEGKFWGAKPDPSGKIYVRAHPSRVMLHRLIAGAQSGQNVDHKDNDGLNNRRENLRIATKAQNSANTHVVRGKSKYKGVFPDSRYPNRWRASVRQGSKRYWLGWFTNEEDAARAYDCKAKELFGEFAKLNFLED